MKTCYLTLICILAAFSHSVYAQTDLNPTTLYEWNHNGNSTGERIVTTINSGPIGLYTGAAITGQIIDGTSNWGYTMPVIANFELYINFSNSAYGLMQDVITPNITLKLKSLGQGQVAIVADCPNLYKQVRVFFRYTVG